MEADQQLRNLKDFLLVYNRMTEICFQRCTSNFNYRNLTMDEEHCVDNCAGKLIRSNHRLMGTYVQLMPRMVQRRMEEMESKAAENAKSAAAAAAAAAAAPAAVGTANAEASPAFQTPINSSPSPNLPPSGTDVTPEAQSSVLKSAGLETLAEPTAASYTAGLPDMYSPGLQTESDSPKPTPLSEKGSTAAPTETSTGKA